MNPGYVYVLINPSMPGLVKIGRTLRDSRGRARKLYTTGVPAPFEVAFEVFSNDHFALEDKMHSHLSAYRPNGDREFFRYPLKDAISLLIKLNIASMQSESSFSATSILRQLKMKYPEWIDPSIDDVQIVQTNDRVWLEVTREEEIAGYLKDQTIIRSDLAFITGDTFEECFFSPIDLVTENARKFVEEFDPFSIAMTTNLFHETACHDVNNKFNPHRKSDA